MKQLCILILTLFLWNIRPVLANDPIIVDSKTDGPDVLPGDGFCSDSNGDCGLRAAVMEANATEGADEIQLFNFVLAEKWNLSTQIDVTDNVTIRGITPVNRIDAQNNGRIFNVVSSRLTLENMTLMNGNAGVSNGGAILTNNSSSNGLNLTNVVIRDSSANNGGAIFANVSFMTIHNSLIENNTATIRTGGVRNVLSGSTTIMSGTTIRNNTAGTDDAGLALSNGLLETTTISDNSSGGNGGGVRLSSGTLTQVTISGNSADSDGGGLILGNSGNMNLLNVTITDNSAGGDGGGIHSSGTTITMRNSILAGNTDTSLGNTPDCFGPSLVSQGYNVIGYINGACVHSGDTANDRFNTSLPALDPDLGPLQYNDHDNDDDDDPFETHVPNVGSPAVNLGNPDGCRTNAAPLINLITEDQRGAERHQQGRCDAGAAESPHGTPTAVAISQQSTAGSQQWVAALPLGLLLVTVAIVWRRANLRTRQIG